MLVGKAKVTLTTDVANGAGVEQQTLGGRGLSGVHVRNNTCGRNREETEDRESHRVSKMNMGVVNVRSIVPRDGKT